MYTVHKIDFEGRFLYKTPHAGPVCGASERNIFKMVRHRCQRLMDVIWLNACLSLTMGPIPFLESHFYFLRRFVFADNMLQTLTMIQK